MENEELKQLLYEALETEMGGVKVYEMALNPTSRIRGGDSS